jgi:cell division protein FtsX
MTASQAERLISILTGTNIVLLAIFIVLCLLTIFLIKK